MHQQHPQFTITTPLQRQRSAKASARLATLLICTAAALPLPAMAKWQLTPFDVAGMDSTVLGDVNDAGQIVGYAMSTSTNVNYSFVYAGGTLQPLPDVAGMAIWATGIANSGLVVGGMTDQASGHSQGFLFESGSYSTYSVPGAQNTNIRHVSSDGRYLTGDYSTDGSDIRGFAYDRSSGQLQTFVTNAGYYIVQGANNLGQITGSFSEFGPAGLVSGGLLFDMGSGTQTQYPTVGDIARPRFRDINESGTIVGFSTTGTAFAGTLAGGFERFSMPGAEITFAYGINNNGTLVGFYTQPGVTGERGFIATSVPEPSQVALMLSGLLALGGWRRLAARKTARVTA